MWIRSQGKHTLMKVNTFQVWDDKKTNIWYVKGIGLCERKLGVYSTEEKALKVLNMLQDFIGLNDVFQMPQDSEV